MANKKNNVDDYLKVAVIVAITVIALSVAYYFVIFIPQKEQQRQAQINLEQEAVNTRLNYNRTKREACLNDVISVSEAFGKPEAKNLSNEGVKLVVDIINKQNDDCLKRYPLQ